MQLGNLLRPLGRGDMGLNELSYRRGFGTGSCGELRECTIGSESGLGGSPCRGFPHLSSLPFPGPSHNLLSTFTPCCSSHCLHLH